MFGSRGDSSRWRACRADAVERVTADEVHVWRVPLDRPESETNTLRAVLSEEERARARRFRFTRHQAHYTVAHGALRMILSRYLAAPASGLRYHTNQYGKPALADGADLRFNLSHSDDLALVAVTRGREVGVDLERVRPDVDVLDLAASYFSAGEVNTLRSLAPELRVQSFFACWTRKEAYIKAIGKGLSQALDRFDVSVEPESDAALLRCEDDPSEVARWDLRSVRPGPGYIGALAVDGFGWRLELRELRLD
jgi:4'-phosphopantetheinyl transferase